MSRVKFLFTSSSIDDIYLTPLIGIPYSIFDEDDNLIIQNEVGEETLEPGKYCIIATAINPNDFSTLYFKQETFEVLDEYPPRPDNIWPPITWDVQFIIYMDVVPFNPSNDFQLPTVPCDELWSYEEDQAEGGAPWLLIGLLVIMALGSGA